MIDKQYFEQDLPELCRKLGDGLRFEVRLIDGDTIDVFRVDTVRNGYVLLTVLPAGGLDISGVARRMREGVDEVLLDRMAVPYSQISHVFLTPARDVLPPPSLSFKVPQLQDDCDSP